MKGIKDFFISREPASKSANNKAKDFSIFALGFEVFNQGLVFQALPISGYLEGVSIVFKWTGNINY